MKKILADKRNVLLILLLILTGLGTIEHGFLLLAWLLAGLAWSIFLDSVIAKVLGKKLGFPKSAAITGLIIAGILNYQTSWLWLFLIIALAIFSKHLIKVDKKHVFNPANFGLLTAALIGLPLTWQLEANIYLIIIVGLYLAYSLRKMPHLLGFLLVFSGLFSLSSVNPWLLVSWFFVFIMLIEPKTSGFGNVRGFVFGALVGCSSYLFYLFVPQIDFFVGSLFVVNLFNPILDRLRRQMNVS